MYVQQASDDSITKMIKEGIALCTITPVEEEKIEEEAVYVQQESDDSITKMIKEGIALCTITPVEEAKIEEE